MRKIRSLFKIAALALAVLILGPSAFGSLLKYKYDPFENGPVELRELYPSLSFVQHVGGVAFMNVAEPVLGLDTKNMMVSYSKAAPDGSRLTVRIGDETGVIQAPDWVAVAAIRFVDSGYTAAFTMTGGPLSDEEQMAPVLKHTDMGAIAFYVDHMLVSPDELRDAVELAGDTSDLPFVSKFDDHASLLAAQKINDVKKFAFENQAESYLYLDSGVKQTFSIENGKLIVTGDPYVLFWKQSGDSWARVLFTQISTQTLFALNPAVFQIADRFSQLVSFLRYYKNQNPLAWAQLVSAVQGVDLSTVSRSHETE